MKDIIVKIGSLLALGFGKSGCKLIKQNMNTDGEINPHIKGDPIVGIFGYCSIKDFP